MLRPKKNSYKRNLITKKNSCGSKIPHPRNFSNGPSLINFIVFMIELLSDGHTTYVSGHHETHVSNENGISLVIWATELDTSLSSSICQPASINKSSSGNRARYGFIENLLTSIVDYRSNHCLIFEYTDAKSQLSQWTRVLFTRPLICCLVSRRNSTRHSWLPHAE